MCLLCSCCSSCFCNWKGIIILLSFITMPSIIANSFLTDQCCLMLRYTSSFLCSQPCIMYAFSSCRCASSHVVAYKSSMDVHTGVFAKVLIAFTFTLIPVISWSLFSVWLLQDSLSTMYMSGPDLYMTYTLYWCIHSIICCYHWVNIALSLLRITNKGLCLMMVHTSLTKH